MKKRNNFLKTCLKKWRNISTTNSGKALLACEDCFQWATTTWPFVHEDEEEDSSIPRDVPKGHLAVYAGENYKRHAIKISLLEHPLFKDLLDKAQDLYGFNTHTKLCIPCEEHVFLNVVYLCQLSNGSIAKG